ncbi:hypothetical protein ABT278_14345 [Streptomyces sp. NPDC001228]|uniref:hypothetical protein n=1 Tax=Streptomyces sp. NPDC001228 TaxID=3154381 RepID=UPI003322F0A8
MSHPYYCLYATEHFALLYNHNQGLPESSGANGVPTAIVEMANAAEEAYAIYTSGEQVGSVTIPGLGYREPGGRVTIFVGDVAHDASSDAAGFTLPVGPGEQPSIWMPQDPEDYDALVRHELFHAFQYQYLSTSGFIWDAATQWFQGDFASLNWWMESTAQWATGRSYTLDPYWPLSYDPGWSSNGIWHSESQYQAAQRSYYLGALDEFLEAPGRALNAWDGLSASRQYGEFPLAEYLSERAGTPDAVRKTWETIGEHDVLPLDAVSTVFAGYGLDLHDELMGFAIANYRLSTPGTTWSQQANAGKGANVTVGGYTTAEAGTAWRDALNSAGSDTYGPARPAHETYDLAWSGSAASTGTQSASLQPGGTLYVDLVPKDTGASDQLGLLTVQVPGSAASVQLPGWRAALIKWPRTSFTGGIQYPTVTQLDTPDSGTISVPVDDARFIETLVLTRTDFNADSTAAMDDTETVSWQAKLTSFNQLDLSTANRRGAVSGLYDWSKAGYREGAGLPTAADINSNAACEITADELATQYGVVPDDGVDDTAGLQNAIDSIKANCSPSASYTKLSRITLPVGVINVSHQIYVDADYLVIRGSGADPATGTAIHFAPDANTRYDTITADGTDWDQDAMTSGSASGGWIWPGRALFRVQSRAINSAYATEYAAAPANRKDLFEGTVNVHWKVGVKLRDKPGDTGFAARTGDTKVYLATNASLTNLKVGGYVNIRAANSVKFYESMNATGTQWPLLNLHMRQQIFAITAVDSTNKTITVDKPLEYDVPVTSISDGSAQIGGTTFDSKASPLVDPVLGVGFENFYLTQDEPNLKRSDATHNYGNMDPAGAMNGILFKWAVNGWVHGIHTEMTGSHPIVTEEAKNLTITGNYLDGAWNKGKGGRGYFRGSRVWDSVYAGNISRNLRHFTFQWSASGNVAIGNDLDSDLNLHGGYERNNLFELNTVHVPYAHRSANCTVNCGEEGGGGTDDSDWYPIWWAAGQKAVKWSGSSGYRNVFFNNTMTKRLDNDVAGPIVTFYSEPHRIFEFGWDGTAFHHLDVGGTPISDWAHNETNNYSPDITGTSHGVDNTMTDPGQSLFLATVPTP